MQICVRDHVEVHPKKKKEVLYFVKKKLGEIGESSDQLLESKNAKLLGGKKVNEPYILCKISSF